VCAETVRRHLRKLDYRVIRPVLSINSPDPDYETKALHLEQCQEQARQGEMILLYEDEVDLNLLPGVIRCWTQRGEQRKILTPGQNQKRYGFGAVNFITGQLTYRVGERKTATVSALWSSRLWLSTAPVRNIMARRLAWWWTITSFIVAKRH